MGFRGCHGAVNVVVEAPHRGMSALRSRLDAATRYGLTAMNELHL